MPGPTATDSNFEQTFSNLAFARLKDKAPSMLDFLIGFQLIDKNDEGSHAVGVFGFKVGSEWIYAPVFFINGELKGHELMYIKGQDAFVPMTEEWVNYTLNRRPITIGEQETRPRHKLGLRQPDFNLFAHSPYGGSKYASAPRTFNTICQNMDQNMLPFMDVFTVSPLHEKFATLNKRMSIPGALKVMGKKAAYALINTMRKNEKFADAILKFYDLKDLIDFEKTAEKVSQQEAGYSNNSSFAKCKECKNYQGNRGCSVVEGDISPEGHSKYFESGTVENNIKPVSPVKSAAAEKHTVEFDEAPYRDKPKGEVVVIVHGDDMSNLTADMSDEDKRKLLRDQYIVRDERSDDQKSRVYKTQLAATLNGPDGNGTYDVMTASGETRKLLIVANPIRVGYNSRRRLPCVLIDKERKQYGNYHQSDVLVAGQHGKLAPDMEGTTGVESLKYDDLAILIGPNNHATNVFRVDRKTTNPDGVVELKVWGQCSASSSSSFFKKDNCCGSSSDESVTHTTVDTIVLTDKGSSDVTQIGATLFVPKSFRALVVRPGKGEQAPGLTGPSHTESELLNLGSLSDVVMKLNKSSQLKTGAHRLQIVTDGIRFTPVLDGRHGSRMSKLAMLRNLIVRHGLDHDDAASLIKEASPRKTRIYWIKYAYGMPEPATFNDPEMGSEPGTDVPVQYRSIESQPLGTTDNQSNMDYYRNDPYVDQSSQQQAQTAASQGQKEILDTAVISGLVKTQDTESVVDGYLSDLMLGLDRLGRILFMFYWHNDKFKERYGQQDMIELEDNLRNVFKNLGELSLFLKQKTMAPDEPNSSEVELDSVI